MKPVIVKRLLEQTTRTHGDMKTKNRDTVSKKAAIANNTRAHFHRLGKSSPGISRLVTYVLHTS